MKIPLGITVWAVVNKEGDVVDVYTEEVKREDLVLHDSERIVEMKLTPTIAT